MKGASFTVPSCYNLFADDVQVYARQNSGSGAVCLQNSSLLYTKHKCSDSSKVSVISCKSFEYFCLSNDISTDIVMDDMAHLNDKMRTPNLSEKSVLSSLVAVDHVCIGNILFVY